MQQTATPACPNEAAHTPHPKCQFAHEAWAEQMLRTYKQTRCLGCRLRKIWVPLPDAPELPLIDYWIDHVACGCCDGEAGCDCEWHRHLKDAG
ncbi:hypothetical protein GCM10010317_008620 [Streptomyces mirabilis]|uniref:hypothetical protein n=1 Tax=Streptomyces mirabilis TaxID=68239 RepID=UPI00167E02D8|nr:hypothetical protein [Streptomyces mirabilis]GHD39727.1 hypothetical protein GCM10010317_008620 [Streptomyces mirabilis]